MGYNAYFARGNWKIMVDGTDVLALALDFIPPTTDEEIYTSGGTSANVYGGEIRVGQKARNKAWGLGVRALGTSPGKSGVQMKLALDRLNHFLRAAGDENNPTYFVWWSDSDVAFEPVFGQGFRRVVVISGYAGWGDGYSIANLRESGVNNCPCSLQIKPYALGRSQVVGTAGGGIYEDTVGYADGLSRGVWIPPVSATGGNYFTNPVFGASTWNTGWTAGANLRAEQNTDTEYIAHGVNSARITKTSTTATYTQSLTLTVATYCLSCYAKKRDGSAITSSDIVLYYNSADVTTTFQTLTNGWYRLFGTVTGVASALATGVNVKILTNSIYVDGFQAERLAYPTPFYYGDMLGCAWASTAHASASSRVAGAINWTQANAGINAAEGTLELVVDAKTIVAGTYLWQWYVDATNLLYLGLTGATTLTLDYYNGTDYLTQGTVAAGKLVIHATWSVAGTKLYCNGVQLGSTQTNQSFIGLTGGTVYLGSYTGTSQSMSTYRHYAIYDRAMTAAQILARYNHFAPLITTDKPLTPIPWMWTLDRDGVFDAYCDTTHADYGVIGGIPGNAPTLPDFIITKSNANPVYVIYSMFSNPTYLRQSTWFADHQGTATAGALNGETRNTTIAAASAESIHSATLTIPQIIDGMNREYWILAVFSDAGSDLTMAIWATAGGQTYLSPYQPITSSATLRYTLIGPVKLPQSLSFTAILTDPTTAILFDLYAIRTTGTNTVKLDFDRLLADTIGIIQLTVSTGSAIDIIENAYILGNKAWSIGTSYTREGAPLIVTGREIRVIPNQINHLVLKHGIGDAMTTTDTITVQKMSITPRWSLL